MGAELEALGNMWGSEIDRSNARELPENAGAVSLRLDAYVLAWLKKAGQGYQTRANKQLEERMLAELEEKQAIGVATTPARDGIYVEGIWWCFRC